MADESHWREAIETADLSSDDHSVLVAAFEREAGLLDELAFTLRTLSAVNGRSFLLALVEELRRLGPDADPGDALVPALAASVIGPGAREAAL